MTRFAAYGVLAALAAAWSGTTAPPAVADASDRYPWRAGPAVHGTIVERFAPPSGYRRVTAAPGGFADWLRHLPLKPAGAKVLLHDGRLKPLQSVHAAVVDIDTGRRDLQQCADAIMRLRAEYLYARGRGADIAFNFTSGDRADFTRWTAGWRPRVKGNRVSWHRTAAASADRGAFRTFLRTVFTYAGTYSLRKEMRPVVRTDEMRIGDAFIEGGFPGHAVLVVDLARNANTGRAAFMLAQGFTPAQDVHVLKNPADPDGGVWYDLALGERLITPEWRFRPGDLRRFR